MPRIDLLEPYAIRLARQSVRDALMSHGEECVLLHMHHVNEAEHDGVPRCQWCFDSLYKNQHKIDCARCYGTSYEGGVKLALRAWAQFTDAEDQEKIGPHGHYHPVARHMHTEWMPDMWQRDYVARIAAWDSDHRVLEVEGIYVLRAVSNESMRTGNWHGQTSVDNISQRADLYRQPEELPIYKFPLVGQIFPRFDGNPR